MVKILYEGLNSPKNLRTNLIGLKMELNQPESVLELQELLQGDYTLFMKLLCHKEPKVRKNAALILGKLKADEAMELLWETYQNEEQLFLKGDYLKAMRSLAYEPYLSKLQKRLDELEEYKPAMEEQKHIREEIMSLQKLVRAGVFHKTHRFSGYETTYEVILTTGKVWQEITKQQIENGRSTILKSGVKVITNDIRSLLTIPTYRELLFPLNVKRIGPNPEQAAKSLAESNLLELLDQGHQEGGTYYFRLGLHSKIPLDVRSEFAKKCGFELEKQSNHRLCNSTSDYEIEIRLMESMDGTFLPLVKLFTLPDTRFSYRKNTVAASIRPAQAAVIAALARPYMKEEAQILDPFCGVGTMLLERNRICPAKVMYGIDIFGPAIAKARENTQEAGKTVYYINRDYFQFTHEYLFDEIITNMPEKGRKTKEEQEELYRNFFEKSLELLQEKGKIMMYCNEKNLVKKHLRLRTDMMLLQEYSMDDKEKYYLFMIEKRG
ncbi:MAG: methyltransferase [Lachnospiraceae bacterium]